MLSQVKSFFCLRNTQIELSVFLFVQAFASLSQENDSLLQICVLRANNHSDLGILERIESGVQVLHHFTVKIKQTCVILEVLKTLLLAVG